MATHYMTAEEAEARSALALVCKACNRVFLYTRELDREVDTVNDRAFVVCPCGAETTLAIGNVTRGSRRGIGQSVVRAPRMTIDELERELRRLRSARAAIGHEGKERR